LKEGALETFEIQFNDSNTREAFGVRRIPALFIGVRLAKAVE
jgi:hypothetical protein